METLTEQHSLDVAQATREMTDEEIAARIEQCHASGMVRSLREVATFLDTLDEPGARPVSIAA